MLIKQKILLVGCGRMGSALYLQWNKNSNYDVYVIDPSKKVGYESVDHLPTKQFSIIVLAVKPQIMNEVLADLNDKVTASLYISIAAGKTLESLQQLLPVGQALIRMMPNTPAMASKGMTVAIANSTVIQLQRTWARSLFESVGQFEWIDDEGLMDQVTAVSGSGPAYVFLLIEELAKAGMAAGLPEELAMKLARQTIIGAAAVCEANPDISAETLRHHVTSPGGTTAAALDILTVPGGLNLLMQKAIAAATARSRELS